MLPSSTARRRRHRRSGAWLNIYDPSTAPDGIVRFKQILAAYEARLPLARYLRSRIVRVPMDLDHPYWVDDSEFDLEFHVRHLALPKPGDWRQLCIQVARIVARPLDLTPPAVGALRDRRPRQRRRRPAGIVRDPRQDPPRSDGRRDGHRAPQRDAPFGTRGGTGRGAPSRGIRSPRRRSGSCSAGRT